MGLRTEIAAQILSELDSRFRHHIPEQSHSMTVMTDERGQVIQLDALLTQIFDEQYPR